MVAESGTVATSGTVANSTTVARTLLININIPALARFWAPSLRRLGEDSAHKHWHYLTLLILGSLLNPSTGAFFPMPLLRPGAAVTSGAAGAALQSGARRCPPVPASGYLCS